ncbi:MAG: MFS transporter, partial [Candidatus Dormibacteraceae bacterium]
AVRTVPARTVTLIGAISMVLGLAVTELALTVVPPALFFAGTVIAGVGFGSAFQGAVRSIVEVTGALERAGVLSLIWIVSYLANGVPAVLAGAVVASGASVLVTARVYALAVMVLVAATVVEVLLLRTRSGSSAARGVEERQSA